MKKQGQNFLVLNEKGMRLYSDDSTKNNNLLRRYYESFANLEMALEELQNSMNELKIVKNP